MSLLDENAWDGLLWEQEQPVAVLQSDVLVDIITAQRQQQQQQPPPETPVIPMVVDAEPNDGTPPRDAKPPRAKKATKRRTETATGKTHRVLKPKLLKNDAYRRLMDEELTMRLRLRYEEEDVRASMRRHRRDDREFWQLLERQRLRREQYYRTRPLVEIAQPLPFH